MFGIPPLYAHQQKIINHFAHHPRNLILADAGTGKTRSALESIRTHRATGGGRTLVICPKSIMIPAWVKDCRAFTPMLSIAVSPAGMRESAYLGEADIVVTNHDAVTWLRSRQALLTGFDNVIIDESTSYKTPNSERSKAIAKLIKHFDKRSAMTGTPRANKLIDIWHQVFLIDDGERLGKRRYGFRNATHQLMADPFGNSKWVEREGAQEAVTDLISDITIRLKLEDCVDLPPQRTTSRIVELSTKLRTQYRELKRHACLLLEEGQIETIGAAALINKLLQVASGAVYDSEKNYHVLDTARYELIAQLCAERDHTLVAFQWRHQRDGIIKALESVGINEYAIIDGEHNTHTAEVVERFQEGQYRVLITHPQSAGHGLTLTRAKTTIWASPTWDAEYYQQFNRRTYRIGQTEKTEIIQIQAEDTLEENVYTTLADKTGRQATFMQLLELLTQPVAA